MEALLQGVTNLRIIYGKGYSAPSGYTKIPTDLNSGAGEEYINLAYAKVPMCYLKPGTIMDPVCIPPGYTCTKVDGVAT